MSPIEIVAFVFGGASVALAAREHVLNFPVGMGMSLAFGALFLDAGLYANAALQVVYLGLAAWGWLNWRRGGQTLVVRRAGAPLLLGLAAGVALVTALLHPLLVAVDDPAPFWDSLTTALSLAAQTLLNLKRLETWYLWLVVDAIYVPFYLSQGLVLTAVVYSGFIGLCLAGLWSWRGSAGRRPAPAPA